MSNALAVEYTNEYTKSMADRAAVAIEIYVAENSIDELEEVGTLKRVGRMIADLMHFCNHGSIDFQAACNEAVNEFRADLMAAQAQVRRSPAEMGERRHFYLDDEE